MLDGHWLSALRVVDRIAVEGGQLQTIWVQDTLGALVGYDEPRYCDYPKGLQNRSAVDYTESGTTAYIAVDIFRNKFCNVDHGAFVIDKLPRRSFVFCRMERSRR